MSSGSRTHTSSRMKLVLSLAMTLRQEHNGSSNSQGCCTSRVNSPLPPIRRMMYAVLCGDVGNSVRIDPRQAPDVVTVLLGI